jgi:hypothetical protein
MPNVNSDGSIALLDAGGNVVYADRPKGRSMDCSQVSEIRRKYVNTLVMRNNNASNIPGAGPKFNQDKFNREPATNGSVDFYSTRGLSNLFYRIGSSK